MTQSTPTPGGARQRVPAGDGGSPWAAGGITFAGVLLMVDGVLGIVKGIAGIASDDVYARIDQYVFKFDVTTWGWVHLVLGVVLLLIGWGILSGALWARATGVGLAALSVVANFMWLPYQPVWAIISVAIDVFVIWALCSYHNRPVA
ncbi:DUF7144 family membrane protein [Streptomyces sp. DT24]|uniref:DUF7144 family membrane protein n=1 Tax=unclassified Streptomyces TaxID=2593676 RepID=UPI0023B9A875|nr:hypothetical protein [Streptomyces sp. AM 4-1-1]WEH33170.1 hypothetical protein PZB75_07125 [Streptomyces sp. AM 4-1-1]